jgi:glycosyltransferase involved in cell wall biosynthesis
MISPRILFVHNYPTRFVTLDLALLRERYQVTELFLERRLLNPLSILAQVQRHDLVFAWFASWHSFFPLLFAKVLRKPSLLVIGGYDLANMPEIGYGHQRGGLKKWVACLTMRLATCLMTNSYYSQKEAERNAKVPKQRIQVVYHGVPDPLGELPLGSRAPMALTVGNLDRSNLRRKGHELFVLAARLVPDVKFVLAGAWKDDAVEYLRTISSPNVAFTGWVDDKTLLDYYRRASVYVQASAHEGFGLAVAEAMLAGCIPVVTRAGALPEVVGDAGVYVSANAPEAIAEGIQIALRLGADSALRARARERILREFPLEKRRKRLFDLIDRLIQPPQGGRGDDYGDGEDVTSGKGRGEI